MAENGEKFYPPASSEIAKLLGLDNKEAAPQVNPPQMVVPQSLPVVEAVVEAHEAAPESFRRQTSGTQASQKSGSVLKVLATVLPYVAVFLVGLTVYYFYLADPSTRQSNVNEQTVAEQQLKAKQEAYEKLKQEEYDQYVAWISQFYFDVSDASVIHPDKVAENGFTNFENYLLRLSPKGRDMLGNGKSDAMNVLDGISPKTGLPLSDADRDIIAQYFDLDAVKKRNNYYPAAATESSFAGSAPAPAPSAGSQNSYASSLDVENKYNINTEIPGRLEVPSMGVNVPIIWTKNTADFDEDLKRGVVHYPGTPLPGDRGTSYVSGHSSNYAWVRADFNRVFAKMGDLPLGATFKVTAVGMDGKDIRFHYIVEHKQEFAADDQAQFTNYADSVVALSTCWPINTVERRLVAFGKLNRVD